MIHAIQNRTPLVEAGMKRTLPCMLATLAIAFAAHGPGKKKVVEKLVELRRRRASGAPLDAHSAPEDALEPVEVTP